MAGRDVIYIAVFLFVSAIALFLINFISHTVVDQTDGIPAMNTTNNMTMKSMQATADALDNSDYLFFSIFIAFMFGTIITGWLVGGHRIFMFIYFLVVVIAIAISTFLTTIWENITPVKAFGDTINNFPITDHIITFLPYYVLAIGFIGIVMMFAKTSKGD
jgi:hypothetical protein